MSKKSTEKEVSREKKQQKAFANVLQATGLSQLKPIQPSRKTPSAPAKVTKKKAGK